MKKILLAGATCYMGNHLLEKLISEGFQSLTFVHQLQKIYNEAYGPVKFIMKDIFLFNNHLK